MPFDAAEPITDPALAKLILTERAKALLAQVGDFFAEDAKRWTSGSLGVSVDNRSLGDTNIRAFKTHYAEAVSFCTLGAIHYLADEPAVARRATKMLGAKISRKSNGYSSSVAHWNDDHGASTLSNVVDTLRSFKD